jgi:hypothetical protein
MNPLATLFRTILTGLNAVIAQIANKNRTKTDFLITIHRHLNCTIQRFEKLVAHWQAGTLPKQRTRPGRKSHPRTTPRLPTRRHWLTNELASTEANGRAYQLQLFLASEDCQKLLAEVPRAARILRPLTRALGLHFPGDPPLPLPKPAPKPKNPWLALPPIVGIVIHRDPPDPYPPIYSKAR